jgi:hypothetical protein
MSTVPTPTAPASLDVERAGDTDLVTPQPVEVRIRFDGHWAGGFELVGTRPDQADRPYVIRRNSDHTILPATFAEDEIRPTGGARARDHG